MKTKEVLEHIKSILNCNQKNLSSILGISQNTLSSYNSKNWDEIKHHQCGQKITKLLFVVEALSKDKTLNGPMIHKIIHTAQFITDNDLLVDVATGIKLQIFSSEQLVKVANAAINHMRAQYIKDNFPSEKSLYYSLQDLNG